MAKKPYTYWRQALESARQSEAARAVRDGAATPRQVVTHIIALTALCGIRRRESDPYGESKADEELATTAEMLIEIIDEMAKLMPECECDIEGGGGEEPPLLN